MTLTLREIFNIARLCDMAHVPQEGRVLFISKDSHIYLKANGYEDKYLGLNLRVDETYTNKQYRVEWYHDIDD